MTYSETIQFLYSLRMFGTKLGLENTFKLAALAGNPQDQLRFIHVAGTNGKGSTCAMLESIYRNAGLRVGLYTSPHLVSFRERIQVNRQLISEEDIIRLVGELQHLLKTFPPESHPTFFEVVTIMGLRYFAEQRCDLVIWETGLGGRLDATNIVTPLASVITSIGLDHERWLGYTVDKIALEKAGIIKPKLPVITSARPGMGLEQVHETALQRGALITVVNENDSNRPPLNKIDLPLRGEFQRTNAALAIAAVRAVDKSLPISEKQLIEGLSTVEWPGRMQLVTRPSGQLVLLDGAHNPAGAEILKSEAPRYFSKAQPAMILGILADKDWNSMAALLAPLANRIFLAPIKSERTLAPADLAPVCRTANPAASVTICGSLAESLQATRNDPGLIIAGSLYLVGEAMELLGLSPASLNDERRLNEWGISR